MDGKGGMGGSRHLKRAQFGVAKGAVKPRLVGLRWETINKYHGRYSVSDQGLLCGCGAISTL